MAGADPGAAAAASKGFAAAKSGLMAATAPEEEGPEIPALVARRVIRAARVCIAAREAIQQQMQFL